MDAHRGPYIEDSGLIVGPLHLHVNLEESIELVRGLGITGFDRSPQCSMEYYNARYSSIVCCSVILVSRIYQGLDCTLKSDPKWGRHIPSSPHSPKRYPAAEGGNGS